MASISTVSVDAEGALAAWLNTLTTTLVGNTHPVDGGFFFEPQRSPYRGAYGVLTRVGGLEDWSPETPADVARMSCSLFATTKKAAALAAVAYANALRGLSTARPAPAGYGVTIRLAGNFSGPLWVPNLEKNRPQYLVDADVYFTQL